MRTFTCLRCREPSIRHARAWGFMCLPCMGKHRHESRRASAEITKAIKRGDLKPAREHACTDCNGQARDWDHRDYLRPLDVEPVCKPCNAKRGPAFDSRYRPEGERELPPVFVNTDRRKTRYAEAA